MSTWFVWGITLAYVFACIALFIDGRPGLGIAYLGWTVGNLGILWDLTK